MPRRSKTTKILHVMATTIIAVIQDALGIMRKTYPQADVIDFLISVAVLVGYFEGRPMTHTKVATFTGIPRPTVVRRVKILIANRILELSDDGKSITTPTYRVVGDGPAQLAAKYVRYVKNAAADFSKMDT